MGLFKKKTAKEKTDKATKKADKKSKPKKGLGKKITDKAKKILPAKDIPFASLLIFKGVIKNRLNKKGIAHDGSLHDMVPKFAKLITAGKHFENFTEVGRSLDPAEAETAAKIVQTVFDFLTNLVKKNKEEKAENVAREKAGLPPIDTIPKEDKEIAEETEKAVDKAVKADNEDNPLANVFSSPMLIIIIVIIIAIIVLK